MLLFHFQELGLKVLFIVIIQIGYLNAQQGMYKTLYFTNQYSNHLNLCLCHFDLLWTDVSLAIIPHLLFYIKNKR